MALSDLFGDKTRATAEQLLTWQVFAQILGALMVPLTQEITRTVNSISQTTPLSPEQLADMVVRNIVERGDAEAYAKQSGVAPSDFLRLTQSAGEPLSPQQLLEALRRQIIPHGGTGPDSVSFEQGIAESRVYNKWRPVLERLGVVPIGPADAVDAVVESQISHEAGASIAFLSGISAEDFQILVNTRGNPPSPTELNVLYRRGLIPRDGTGPEVTSVQQGIFEGATKNKWWELLNALSEALPPPRTIVAMIREGSLTDQVGLQLLREQGIREDLAAAYVSSAHHQKTQPQRDLTVGIVKSLYQDGIIPRDLATQLLELLTYTAQDAAWLEDVWDFETQQTKVRTAIARIHSLYVAHKLTEQQASTFLDGLEVPAQGKQQLLTLWALERTANVPELTRAEIVDAWYWGVVDEAEALQLLLALGWTEREARILFGIRTHGGRVAAPPRA